MDNNYSVNLHKQKIWKIETILDNHGKLLSMLSPKILPIKQSLLQDVSEIRHILEVAKKKENDKNLDKNAS